MCVILYTEIDGKQILAKNRDRAYKPNMAIVHEIINGIEVAYIMDLKSGWIEGINELGTAMVNSSMNVNDGVVRKKKTPEQLKMKKERNKFYQSLIEKDKEKVLKNLTDEPYSSNYVLEGHTILVFNDKIYHIETDVKRKYAIEKINKETVYANHGINFKNEGFVHGRKGFSSFIRKKLIEKELDHHTHTKMNAEIYDDFMSDIMNVNYKNIDPRFHSYRDKNTTLKQNKDLDIKQVFVNTTGQILINVTDRELVYYHDKNNSEKVKYVNKLPRDYVPKIRVMIRVIEKNQRPTKKLLTRRYLNKMCKKFDYYDKHRRTCPFFNKTRKNRKSSLKNKTYRDKEDNSK
jgi:hypothetical protein